MDDREHRFLERRIVSWVLRTGVALATTLMLVGLVMAGIKHRLRAHPVRLAEVPARIHGGHPSAYLELGILVLHATPLIGVLLLIAGFAKARDWRFAAVASLVAVLLATGILLGRA